MATTRSEELTARFYAWEQIGRGWWAFEEAVHLEPVFHPFFGHYLPSQEPVDDTKRHTIFSFIGSLFREKQRYSQHSNNDLVEIPPVQAMRFICEDALAVFKVTFPKGEKVELGDMEQLLLMLSYTRYPVSFEVIGTQHSIRIQVACRTSDEKTVTAQVKAYFPSAIVSIFAQGLDILLDNAETCVMDFGLHEEFMRPMQSSSVIKQDPYVGIFAALENLKAGECGVIQVLFQGTENAWTESVMRAVSDGNGDSFFVDDPDMLKLAREKTSAPLFAVCVRAVGQSDTVDRSQRIAKDLAKAITRQSDSGHNCLTVLFDMDYPVEERIHDVYLRQSHRLGMILSSRELSVVAHFPTSDVHSPLVERDAKKTKAAPAVTNGNGFVIGINEHQGKNEKVTVPVGARLKHTHIIGATGTGKSTLFLSMVAQDMQQGNGVAVLDPHGDLIETILTRVPKERINDVILIDPADGEYPVAFNILSAHSEVEKDILSSDLVAAFKRLSTSWGDQMNSVFANAILAFLESSEGGTLADLRRFLIEKPYRDKHLKTVKDAHIVYYWEHEYPLLKSSSLGSILTRLDTFLRPKLIRNMVAQKKGLDFEAIMDGRKILLVKLSQGLIGAENSFLLGTFFVSKIYQAAMARQAKADRKDFFFYIDEFHHFATPSMSHILSGARKYHLGLILAHQDMQQLSKHDTELASAVAVNAGTRICFRLGDTDAHRFAKGFSFFDAEDLENLNTGEAIARIEQPNYDFNLSTSPLPTLNIGEAEQIRRLVIERSRAQNATRRADITLSDIPVGISVHEQPQSPVPEPIPEMPKSPAAEPFKPEVVEAPPKRKKKPETEHRYLQTLVKRLGEERGYKASIEEVTPDGKGRVDVSLERDGKRIACEISVTTGDTWEIHNIEKCLAAGYDEILVCSSDAKNLEKIRQQITNKLNEVNQSQIHTYSSQDIQQYFDKQVIKGTTTEKVMKGYKIQVEYGDISHEEMRSKQAKVGEAVAKALRKKKQ